MHFFFSKQWERTKAFTSSCSFLRKLISSCRDSTFRSRSSLARAALSTSCTVTLALNKVTCEGHVNNALQVCWHNRKWSRFTCCGSQLHTQRTKKKKKRPTMQQAKVKVTCIQWHCSVGTRPVTWQRRQMSVILGLSLSLIQLSDSNRNITWREKKYSAGPQTV